MSKILPIGGVLRRYSWGSRTFIPELLGVPPDGSPQAELWLGAHTAAPSWVCDDETPVPLTELIDRSPEEILGKETSERFKGKLPFLFKVLAAERPLSIQAHPDKSQAQEGFQRESEEGIGLDAYNRSYKDSNHKPECICALTEFWALNGFRRDDEIISMLGNLCPRTMIRDLKALKNRPGVSLGLREFFGGLMSKAVEDVTEIIKEAARNAERLKDEDPAYGWVLTLKEEYPGDIGALSPVILNLVCLKPGEALYLDAGRLHAYLDGVGIELMANSDNVLRGGLTPKHIDLPELSKVLRFEETLPDILTPVQKTEGERVYHTSAEEFLLSEISVNEKREYRSPIKRSVEIMLCVRGEARVFSDTLKASATIEMGKSILIPASLPAYRISGDALIYKATVGSAE